MRKIPVRLPVRLWEIFWLGYHFRTRIYIYSRKFPIRPQENFWAGYKKLGKISHWKISHKATGNFPVMLPPLQWTYCTEHFPLRILENFQSGHGILKLNNVKFVHNTIGYFLIAILVVETPTAILPREKTYCSHTG